MSYSIEGSLTLFDHGYQSHRKRRQSRECGGSKSRSNWYVFLKCLKTITHLRALHTDHHELRIALVDPIFFSVMKFSAKILPDNSLGNPGSAIG